ncbi:D-alanine--D-alanine ligase family protein [Gulosibacter molinativorax]|uniref:D-alanine--D-alanine ligase n=1 Tax=Gulosibacter molinativorax TaxID=256821 RepID=A0ABT7C939_9MICO|nr:D-alanine--D-alanine ligase [Gulosibacter molinativorax]MDJ1371707.1 D-alanine--D-alanine ligase [Gulosibacter molinativorax]QUY63128.1 D-alanine--D-alanine ligase [Gulosibacter molinativorax]
MTIEGQHVVILSGGISHERDVSLRSGRRVADALIKAGARVTVREPDEKLLPWLEQNFDDVDVVWPVLHGVSGENGALYSLLRAIDVPYVGSRPTAAMLAWNKATAKALVKRTGIRTPQSIVLPNDTFRELGATSVIDSISRGIDFPAVVKPVEGGSSQGVSFVNEKSQFSRALVTAFTYADGVLIEKKVSGTELMVGVLDFGEGPFAVPPVEVVPNSGVYDYAARYNAGETTYYAPGRVDEAVLTQVSELAVRVCQIIGLADVARVDFIVDDEGTPWFIEADPIPGMTETSLVPLGIQAAGLELADVYAQLAEHAAARGPRNTPAQPNLVV